MKRDNSSSTPHVNHDNVVRMRLDYEDLIDRTVVQFHRGDDPNRHLDARFGWRHPDEAAKWHADCTVGVCATLTTAIIKLRGRWWY